MVMRDFGTPSPLYTRGTGAQLLRKFVLSVYFASYAFEGGSLRGWNNRPWQEFNDERIDRDRGERCLRIFLDRLFGLECSWRGWKN